jgi:hypothetical protein
MKKSTTFYLSASICILASINGCKKFVAIDAPTNTVNQQIVYNDIKTASAVLNSIYTNLNTQRASVKFVYLYSGLSSDELTLFNIQDPVYKAFFSNSLTPEMNTTFWPEYYRLIFQANSVIEGLAGSRGLDAVRAKQILGEAKFIRAYLYFYLINFYGDVPLILSTDYKKNALLPRTPKSDVYVQIINDLKDCQILLNAQYMNVDITPGATERVRPNASTATALLARAYLYNKDYSKAIEQASQLINNPTYQLEPLSNVFKKDSKEAIWQLYGVGDGFTANTEEGRLFILPQSGPSSEYPVYLGESLYNSFDVGDQRKANWINEVTVLGQKYAYPYKYKVGFINQPVVEYSVVFRLAEQYLIRAEARILLGQVQEGLSDLNVLRRRATDLNAPVNLQLQQIALDLSKNDAMKILTAERLHELFSEGAHRWFDLKRETGFVDNSKSLADELLPVIKGNSWQSTDQLYPIPKLDIDLSPGLAGHQNPGY